MVKGYIPLTRESKSIHLSGKGVIYQPWNRMHVKRGGRA
jgi:hypothetical protein